MCTKCDEVRKSSETDPGLKCLYMSELLACSKKDSSTSLLDKEDDWDAPYLGPTDDY